MIAVNDSYNQLKSGAVGAFSGNWDLPYRIENAYTISIKNAHAGAVYQAETTVNQYLQILQDKADTLLAEAVKANPAQFDSVFDTASVIISLSDDSRLTARAF